MGRASSLDYAGVVVAFLSPSTQNRRRHSLSPASQSDHVQSQLVRGAALLDAGGVVVLDVLKEAQIPTRYEAVVEAMLTVRLIIRYVEGVASVARNGVVMYPTAMVLARAAFESALRTLWMLEPDNEFDRERRYLARLEETERLNEDAARAYTDLGADEAAARHAGVAEAFRQFREAVVGKLPDAIPPQRLPNLRAMLAESGYSSRYLLYRFASQFAHGTMYATGVYRRHLGTAKEFGEYIEPRMWAEPLQIAWWTLHAPAERLLEVNGIDAWALAERMPAVEMKRTVDDLRTGHPEQPGVSRQDIV